MIEYQHQEAGRRGARERKWEGLARTVGRKPEASRAPGKQVFPENEAAVSHSTGRRVSRGGLVSALVREIRGSQGEEGMGGRKVDTVAPSLQLCGGMITFLLE